MDSRAPLTKDAASEHSQITPAATSSEVPMRPTTILPRISSDMPGVAISIRSRIGVWIAPGRTAFTRTPLPPYSSAAVRVIMLTPALLTR